VKEGHVDGWVGEVEARGGDDIRSLSMSVKDFQRLLRGIWNLDYGTNNCIKVTEKRRIT
jgi:hypothetical protein